MRKLIAGVGMAALTLVATGFASAATIDNVNGGSTADIFSKWSLRLFLHNDNVAYIGNAATAGANSGENTVTSANDQYGTSVTTGNATAASVVDNVANTNEDVIGIESSGGGDDCITTVSGGSTADIDTLDYVKVYVHHDNAIENLNEVAALTNTGSNEVVSGDTLNTTTVHTGSNDASTGIVNSFNINFKELVRTIRFR